MYTNVPNNELIHIIGTMCDIYKVDTTTIVIIPKDSCHPVEHKLAGIRYFTNRINTYSLDFTSKEKEINTVKQIAHSNKYVTTIVNKVSNNKQSASKMVRIQNGLNNLPMSGEKLD